MKPNNLKVALVHDYIKEYGGAERVLETLREIFPDAQVFTIVYCPKFLGPHQNRFNPPAGGWDIRTSVAQYLPFKEKLISPLRLVAPFLFRQFDFSGFDIVIVSATGAYSPNTIRIKNNELRIKEDKKTLHICYCHTPPRYLYGYATARDWKKNVIWRILGELANHFLRLIDYKSSQNVDLFIANSEEVSGRIWKFYRKKAIVVYPPVDILDDRKWKVEDRNLKIEGRKSIYPQSSSIKNQSSNIDHPPSKKDYYLAGGRLARAKHIDLIVKACREQNLPLKVFGRGFAGYESELRIKNNELGKETKNHNSKFIIHNSNVEFLGEVTDEEKFALMKNAKAYIFAGEDEDFGILPVESMGAGTPVIAYKSGGVKETVIEGKTGVFFEELSISSLKKAIEKLNNITIKPQDCIRQAEKFSKERFVRKIRAVIEKNLK